MAFRQANAGKDPIMGQVISFPTAPSGQTYPAMQMQAALATLAEGHSGLPELVSAMGSVSRSTEQMCRSFQSSLRLISAAFEDALQLNAAHQQLQRDTQAAIDMVDHDPEGAAVRLAELRADYARLRKPGA